MECFACGGWRFRSSLSAPRYRRFCYRDCGKQFSERTGGSSIGPNVRPPLLVDNLRRRLGRGSGLRRSWYVDEAYIDDRTGALADVMLSEIRDTTSAEKAHSICQSGDWRHYGPGDHRRA
jgi:hypothetical protein